VVEAPPLSGADGRREHPFPRRRESWNEVGYPLPLGQRVSGQLGARSATGIIGALLLVAGCGGAKADEETIALARQAYAKAKARGVEMSRGPCLGVIKEGWVADVAHDPRREVDERPENQCAAYREGDADHFVELDPKGNLIRSG
jgi:cobalamin biosynthesis Mg chelatase CobN